MPIAPQIGAAALSAGASALGSIINAFTGSHQRKQALRDSKAMMNYQNEINLKNWRLQNKYNSPSSQLERLRAAGLNPSLHGIDGSTIPMQSVGLAENSAALTAGSNRQAALSGMLDASSQLANVALLKSQKQNIDEDTRAKQIENDKKEFERSSGGWTEDVLSKWWNNEISSYQASELWLNQLRNQYKSQVFNSYYHDGKRMEIEANHTAFRDVDLELSLIQKELQLKDYQMHQLRSLAFNLYYSAVASMKNADSNAARVAVQNDLDKITSFMYQNGFTPQDSPLDRILKKVGEAVGVSFSLPLDK